MAAKSILSKFGARVALTIDLDSLASSAVRVGRQSTIISNATTRYTTLEIAVKVTVANGTTPTANTAVHVHLIRSNGVERSDSAGTTDAGLTQNSASSIGVLQVGGSPVINQVLEDLWVVNAPFLEWGVMIWHDLGVALHASAGNVVSYVGKHPEIQ